MDSLSIATMSLTPGYISRVQRDGAHEPLKAYVTSVGFRYEHVNTLARLVDNVVAQDCMYNAIRVAHSLGRQYMLSNSLDAARQASMDVGVVDLPPPDESKTTCC